MAAILALVAAICFALAAALQQRGQFKLAGLGSTELLDESFDPLPSYQPTVPRSDDALILAI